MLLPLLICCVSVFSGENAVVFLHGFPEIWYSWRHQMIAFADAGFRAIAFDYRAYGLSDPPLHPETATWSNILDDLLHILKALQLPKVYFSYSLIMVCYFACIHDPVKVRIWGIFYFISAVTLIFFLLF